MLIHTQNSCRLPDKGATLIGTTITVIVMWGSHRILKPTEDAPKPLGKDNSRCCRGINNVLNNAEIRVITLNQGKPNGKEHGT